MHATPSATGSWGRQARPWSLEVLTLLFTVLGLAEPFVQRMIAGSSAPTESETSIGIMLWPALLMGTYIVHRIFARSAPNCLSTPFSYLIAPPIAATLCYMAYAYKFEESGLHYAWISTSPLAAAFVAFDTLVVTLVLSRLHMLDNWKRIAGSAWEIDQPARRDGTIWSIAAQFYPLAYRPAQYLACPDGVVVKGWHFLVALPFKDIRSIAELPRGDIAISGYYFVSSDRDLLRIDLSDNTIPFYLSPEEPTAFMEYMRRFTSVRRAGTHARTTA